MDNVERSLSTSKNTCRGTRALKEKGRAKGVRRGASRRTYFPGARLAPWQFCHACFSPRFMPAHPPFNDVSCLLYGYYRASSALSRPPSPSPKVIITDNRCLAFFRHLRDAYTKIPPPPQNLLLLSCWIHLSHATYLPSSPIFPALKHASDIKNTNVLNLRSSSTELARPLNFLRACDPVGNSTSNSPVLLLRPRRHRDFNRVPLISDRMEENGGGGLTR